MLTEKRQRRRVGVQVGATRQAREVKYAHALMQSNGYRAEIQSLEPTWRALVKLDDDKMDRGRGRGRGWANSTVRWADGVLHT
jgi:hypothetical protein